MYIKKLIDINVGPLTDVKIDFPFYDNENPKPIVLVGENGSGKSTVLSNIVDSFIELAKSAFNNVTKPEGAGYQFFKSITPAEIHTGSSYMYSYISFKGEKDPKYVFKSGNISLTDFQIQTGENTNNNSWVENGNWKRVFADKETIEKIWNRNVICYFGPDRYEKPVWMGNKYYSNEELLHPNIIDNLSGHLKNEIIVQDVNSKNLSWLLDVIADSRADISGDVGSLKLANTFPQLVVLLRQARNNLETILSKIIGENVYFQLNLRNSGGSRFKIIRKSDNTMVCPTLDSLSTGQIALFNLFSTIVRYADNNDINHSFHLNNITGIVVIDEIELHLHSKLQKEVLPELIKLFPKIQFIITSHSPLFLLGMREVLGEEGFEIYEMPNAEKIGAEHFCEFSRAYDYLKDTEQYQHDIKQLIGDLPDGEKTIIVTEGSTDWKHMKVAQETLNTKDEYKELFEGLDFDYLEYEPANSELPALLKIEMGDGALVSLCKSLAKLPNHRKYIVIADCDVDKIKTKLTDNDAGYKKWSDNTYSAVLPVPELRKETPQICIEHYYTDEEIEKEIETDGVKRHLFMGKDFDTFGHNYELGLFCERKDLCGENRINIIEGSQGDRVYKLSDEGNQTNYALPKSKFVDYVIAHPDEFDFENFVPLFELIKTIIKEENENA